MIKHTILAIVTAFCTTIPVLAEPVTPNDYKTPKALGCMILRECKKDVVKITSLQDLRDELYRLSDTVVEFEEEINSIISNLETLGVEVFLGDEFYFLRNQRGVYQSQYNRLFLNRAYMSDQFTLLEVLRHEGWHAAQDIMAGSIDNSNIAIIFPEEDVPAEWVVLTDFAYANNPAVLPWEREAKWAGMTLGMTREALEAATRGPLWETYEPTPLTRKWLVENGFIVE